MSSKTLNIREINYQDNEGQNLVSYFAVPKDETPLAAVLVFPEWWGRNDYIEKRARELAELGYAAFAVDMYGDKKLAADVPTASQYMMATFDQPNTIVDRAKAAFNTIASQPEVDAARIAAIGFCYGGKVALDLARSGANLKAVNTFHANLSAQNPAQANTFKAEVIVAHGADDTMVSLDDVEQFKQEMAAANVTYQVDIYPNTKHGFTNPAADEKARQYGVDLGYNAESEVTSITKLHDFLARTLK